MLICNICAKNQNLETEKKWSRNWNWVNSYDIQSKRIYVFGADTKSVENEVQIKSHDLWSTLSLEKSGELSKFHIYLSIDSGHQHVSAKTTRESTRRHFCNWILCPIITRHIQEWSHISFSDCKNKKGKKCEVQWLLNGMRFGYREWDITRLLQYKFLWRKTWCQDLGYIEKDFYFRYYFFSSVMEKKCLNAIMVQTLYGNQEWRIRNEWMR